MPKPAPVNDDSLVLPVAEAQAFLYHEADLLDNWQLLQWAQLFSDDGEYLVPATSVPNGDPSSSLFLIYDDRHRLEERARRLLKRSAHAEYPHSQTRHMVANVTVGPTDDLGMQIRCNFVVYRSRGDRVDVFPGHSVYSVVRADDNSLRIRRKRATLDIQTLRPHGRVSIIL